MRYAINSAQAKAIDDYTTQAIGIPSRVLMERAALEAVKVIKEETSERDRILVVCGPGNNGGDGIAAGRLLYLMGCRVAICLLADELKCSEGLREQLAIARNLGMTFENSNKLHEYNIIIDAIFGVGLTRDVSGDYEAAVNAINSSPCKVYSLDIPSGISSDTGKIMNVAVKACRTITFGYMKQGMLVFPGAEYAGEITVADIGFPQVALEKASPDTYYYDGSDISRLPARYARSHKGTYGKVLIIAGSPGMSGAAYLSAMAAYRTGAGLVKVLSSADNRIILQSALPEALFTSYDSNGKDTIISGQELSDMLSWADVIAIGPGLSRSDIADRLLTEVLENARVPLVIDADAINLLAMRLDRVSRDSRVRLDKLSVMLPGNTILTPHVGELYRLTGIAADIISDNIIDTAGQCSYNNSLIYVLKDARTVVAGEGLRYINVSGNNGMAVGGSGDVLTGIIAALVAQGMSPFEAACLGVYIHGLAGDAAAVRTGYYSLMAGDIIEALKEILQLRSDNS